MKITGWTVLAGLVLAPVLGTWAASKPEETARDSGNGTHRPPFPYVWATAYHVLPETTSEESGYFSLCEGRDGSVYVGTAKYGVNAYLVEFDPARFSQRIVIDTHQVCGLSATGYAAQSKIHTRNFVGPSGVVYVGSKQGYRRDPKDLSDYPGGYVMTYDPRTGRTENLGMPYPGQGVIDIVADEVRGLLYAVTCEEQHWMIRSLTNAAWRELGPRLTPFATTLVDAQGRAHALSTNFDLCTYDPATDRVSRRPIVIGRQPFVHPNENAIPTWNLAADGRTAYLILMNDPTLLAIDLVGKRRTVKAVNCGRLTDAPGPDSRSSLSIGPDGRVWTLVRTANNTGFGGDSLHRLFCYDPRSRRIEEKGVLAVKNPDFYDFSAKKPYSHGYQTLPDGTLIPSICHIGLVVAHDNTIYVTILYPYTLLRIDAFRTPSPASTTASPAAQPLNPRCGQIRSKAASAAPDGNHWSGTLAVPNGGASDGPFASLSRVRDAIRALKASGGLPPGGVTVTVPGGEYRLAEPLVFSAEDSGTAEAPVVYRAAEGETVRLSGGVAIAGWRPVADAAALQRLPPEARGHVVVADLRAQGVRDYGVMESAHSWAQSDPGLEVFFRGARMTLARYPNEGFLHIAGILAKDGPVHFGSRSSKTGRFRIEGEADRLRRRNGCGFDVKKAQRLIVLAEAENSR